MGYFSTVEQNLRIRRGCMKRFRKALQAEKKRVGQTDGWGTLLLGALRLVGREITYDDSWGKWDGDFEFAKFLVPYVESGTLRFVGEDGERWGYLFDGDGNVFALTWREEISKNPIIRAADSPPKCGKSALSPAPGAAK